ncbi:MAG: SMC-Scp complex subunit ScpB [Eubacteriales bacterium]|nr:SMC-Scp complex subunit ScpB [Eubacteriales bacterium]
MQTEMINGKDNAITKMKSTENDTAMNTTSTAPTSGEDAEIKNTEFSDSSQKSETIELPDSELPDPELYAEEIIEAVLFAAGHPVKFTAIASLLDVTPEVAKEKVTSYAKRYNRASSLSRGVILIVLDDCCQLCTKQEYMPYIRAALGIRRNGNLSASSIETLAIIAYNQPITRSYIDMIRKVDSSYAVSSLLDRGLIESKGRLDAPGRPMLYGTTPDFLRSFGLNSLSELPSIMSEESAEMFERMKNQLALDMDVDKNQIAFDIENNNENIDSSDADEENEHA